VIMDDILHPEEPQVDITHEDELDSFDLVWFWDIFGVLIPVLFVFIKLVFE
jgi:hypothetical protein